MTHQNNKCKIRKENTSWQVHLFFVVCGFACLIPFLTVVSASFSNEIDLLDYGFSVLPRKIDFTAYKYLFENPKVIIDAYKITIFITLVGTVLGVLVMSMASFCLARNESIFKKLLTWYIFIPTLFSGGLTASYIINTQYLHLNNKIWALILPGLVNIFHVFMIRTFLQQLPESLFDAAKIDGASEYAIYFRMALPLSKPVLATVAFLTALGKWNSWYEAMLYIRDDELVPLQYMLQRRMMSIDALLVQMKNAPPGIMVNVNAIPGESLRMAMLVVSVGPMMCIFPFFQKYFVKGMTVGAVKG